VLLVAAVMFVNILDFMMVMPLGPDFSQALQIPAQHLGWIAGSYTFAAMLSGLASAMVLDAIDRRTALLASLAGLLCATALCGAAWDLPSLMGFRFLAGLFGGPVTAVGFAIIADVIAPERRGRAVGKAMGAFSLASVLGVPFGLEIAHYYGWNAPFFFLAALIAGVCLCTWRFVPALPVPHVYHGLRAAAGHLLAVVRAPIHWVAFAALACGMSAAFMLIPNIAAHLQMNLGYPRAGMGMLYFIGGAISLFGMRFAGSAVDRFGATPVSLLLTLVFVVDVWLGFVVYDTVHVPVMVLFSVFMVATTARNISAQSINTRVPSPQFRAAFTSLQSSVTHFSTSIGAFVASEILIEVPGQGLLHMPMLGWLVITIACCVPPLVWQTERWVKRAEKAQRI
jgi:predicted MFS family arabinose efflux permease